MVGKLASAWRSVVFAVEFLGVLLLGVPVGIFVGLAIGVFVYFITFRVLKQQLVAMWKRRSIAEPIAAVRPN